MTVRPEPRGLPDKPLAELSDEELSAELAARRRRRGMTAGEDKHYASLELPIGAPREAIERAYARLRAKYEPFAAAADRERSQAAQQLLDGLRRAYDALKGA